MNRTTLLRIGCCCLLAVFAIGMIGCGGGSKPVDGPAVTEPQQPQSMQKPPAPPPPPS